MQTNGEREIHQWKQISLSMNATIIAIVNTTNADDQDYEAYDCKCNANTSLEKQTTHNKRQKPNGKWQDAIAHDR